MVNFTSRYHHLHTPPSASYSRRSSYIRPPESILVTSVEPGQRPYALATSRLWLLSPWWAWLASPKGGILSSPQNFNLVCFGMFCCGGRGAKAKAEHEG